MPPQFALRARGHRAHVVLDSRPKQHPSLLGLLARSAFHATLGQDAPCGLGVSAPSPQAPPQWGKVRFLPVLYPKVSSTFSKVAGSRGSEATEVWVPAQTSGAQAPFFGGLLGPSVRSAAYAATPPQFALRARGRCPLPAGPTPMGQSALFTCFLSKSFVHLFKGGGVEGQ